MVIYADKYQANTAATPDRRRRYRTTSDGRRVRDIEPEEDSSSKMKHKMKNLLQVSPEGKQGLKQRKIVYDYFGDDPAEVLGVEDCVEVFKDDNPTDVIVMVEVREL